MCQLTWAASVCGRIGTGRGLGNGTFVHNCGDLSFPGLLEGSTPSAAACTPPLQLLLPGSERTATIAKSLFVSQRHPRIDPHRPAHRQITAAECHQPPHEPNCRLSP